MAQRISVGVPATSANLGCAFDCAALALNLYLDISVAPRADKEVTVAYRGVNPDRIPTDRTNMIVSTMLNALAGWHKERGFDLEISNQIPVGVGLGSSAAAIVGGLAASHYLADATLFDDELVSLASRLEGHPDNVAAAWHGGFTVTAEEGGRAWAYSCPVPDPIQFVVVVPDFAVSTEKARQVLPAQYSREDAVHNLQRAAVLAALLFSGRPELHRALFNDRWHQPFRAALVPGLAEVLEIKHPDLVGICLSAAGPSVLCIVRSNAQSVGEAVAETFAGKGVTARAHVLAADNLGAKGWSLPG